MAGENFFRTLEDLLRRQDSELLADVLEVYELCLLMGFRGRYGMGDPARLQQIIAAIQAKVQRVRGGNTQVVELAPDWQLPAKENISMGRDAWSRRLAIIAVGTFTFALVLYFFFWLALRSGLGELSGLV